MTPDTYTYWVFILMLINTLPHITVAYLSFKWRSFSMRRWVRAMFLGTGLLVGAFALFRVVVIVAFYDVEELRLGAAILGTITNFLMAVVLWLCTHVFEVKRQRVLTGSNDKRTSDLLGDLISTLEVEGRRKGWL